MSLARQKVEQLDQLAPPSVAGPTLGITLGGPSARDRAEQAINEQLTEGRVTKAISDYQRQQHQEGPSTPAVEHSPIDEAQQTGESRLLGGEMRIRAPWADDQ